MHINKHIMVAVFGIAGISIVQQVLQKKPLSPIIEASYLLLVVLSLADLAGGAISELAGGIAMLALFTTILDATQVWQFIAKVKIAQGK